MKIKRLQRCIFYHLKCTRFHVNGKFIADRVLKYNNLSPLQALGSLCRVELPFLALLNDLKVRPTVCAGEQFNGHHCQSRKKKVPQKTSAQVQG